ncbi:MAG: OmpA family protein [Hahellaceae bacterium]|nr:OmpA family protein [Hahellaceae bacterium]MCP5169165.1 OmpA family protein [Hahellaceae bacterium]
MKNKRLWLPAMFLLCLPLTQPLYAASCNDNDDVFSDCADAAFAELEGNIQLYFRDERNQALTGVTVILGVQGSEKIFSGNKNYIELPETHPLFTGDSQLCLSASKPGYGTIRRSLNVIDGTVHGDHVFYLTQGVTTGAEPCASDIVKKLLDTKSIDMHVHFAVNQSSLDPAAIAQVNELAKGIADIKKLRGKNKPRFEVVGHTDSQGNKKKNLSLSKARAKSVADYLKANKDYALQDLDFAIKGLGDTALLVKGKRPEDHAQNRRVEVKLLN